MLPNLPVTKGLLILVGCNTAISQVMGYSHLYFLSSSHIFKQNQFWRLFTSQLIYSNSTQLILGSIMLYNLRIVERHLGSIKYSSLYFACTCFSVAFQIVMMNIFKIDKVEPGPLAFVHFLLCYYSARIPSLYETKLNGLIIRDNFWLWIVALQVILHST